MKNRVLLTSTIIVVVILIIILSFKAKSGENQKIKVGVIAPLSGIVADYGEQVKKGVESVNAPKVQFVFEDDQCDAKTAVSAYKKLTELDHIDLVIGPECGSPQDAVAPLLSSTTVVALMPAAASNSLYDRSGGNFYNVQYSLEQEAAFLADRMYSMGYKRVAVISYQNEFSQVERENFIKSFKGTITHDINFATDNADVLTELTKIKKQDYDAIFSNNISFYFANGLQKMRNLGINVPVFSPYPVELPAVRNLVEGVYYSFPADINDGQGGVYGLSKQAAALMVQAVEKCGDTYRCVKDYFSTSGFDAQGVMSREIILKQIKNSEPVIVK